MCASFFKPMKVDQDLAGTMMVLTPMGLVYLITTIAVMIWVLVVNKPTPTYQQGDFVRLLVSGEVGQVTKSSCRAFNAECSYNIRVGNHDTVAYKAFELDADIHIQPGN